MNNLDRAVHQIIDDEIYRTAFWGIGVADVVSGEMLYALNSGKLFAPASTTKLWSCAALLDTYGVDHRFITPVYQRGELSEDGTLAGDLILHASGDPNFSGRLDGSGGLAFKDHDHTYADWMDAEFTDTDPLDGVDDLARQIAASGIRQARDLVIDDRLFERAPIYEGAPFRHSPIMINDNLIDVVITPTKEIGQPAQIELRPINGYAQFDNQVITVQGGQATSISIDPVSEHTYTIHGQIELGHPPVIRIAYLQEPQNFARTVLIDRLSAHGVQIEANGLSANPSVTLPAEQDYASLKVVAQHTSPRLAELLKIVLKVSHNIQAGVLPLLLAAHYGQRTHSEGMLREGDFLKRIGIDPCGAVFGSGSGGSPSDHSSPDAAIQLLRAMAARPDARDYRTALPILGVDGTLADAVEAGSPARGAVQAKTGTLVAGNELNGALLLGSKALAGYLTAQSGRELVIALYVNRVLLPDPAAAMSQGKVLGALCELFYASL